MRTPRRLRSVLLPGLLPVLLAGGLAACSPTTYDEQLAPDTAVSTTTTLPSGTAADLLPQLKTVSGSLSGVMIAEGDVSGTGEQIDALWAAVRDEVRAGRPDLIDGFDQAIALIDKAVRFSRSADADKAARNIATLVDAWFA